ncbi:MAG: hypothetical protein OXP74_00200 [Acidobacteriota bacterium]|nr:hypothetical protein [Acidobacteriota bacterium]
MSAPASGNGAVPAIDAEAIRTQARTLGIDLVGFCSWRDLEAEAPDYDKPSQLSTYLTQLIVLAKRYPTGVARSPDAAFRQYANGRVARHLEEAAGGLAYWLEEHDAIACILSAAIPDLRRQPMAYAGPGGQGSLLLRQAAAASGLGTLGLNEMILTPEYGPRVFLAGVLTDADVECGRPLADELCPGLEECGRCAEVCPVAAIPKSAPPDTPLAEVRGLDAEACARACQPFGPDRMVEHLADLFASKSAAEAVEIARNPLTQQIFYNLTVQRQGAYTGCQSCQLACPVGEDYERLDR